MPVEIILIAGNEESAENHAARQLANVFRRDLPQTATGSLCIAASVQVIGQEVRDIDIVVFGALENAPFRISIRQGGAAPLTDCMIYLNSFLFTIEVKDHDLRDICLRGTQLLVSYDGRLHDATSQSEKQKYALLNYLKERLNQYEIQLFACNFVWLRNIQLPVLQNLLSGAYAQRQHNIFSSEFDVKYLVGLLARQKAPYFPPQGGASHIACLWGSMGGTDGFNRLHAVFAAERRPAGALTRRKLELLAAKLMGDDQRLLEHVGSRLVILAGRAGTGKTMRMLNLACQLAQDRKKRCLFLTFNRPLVQDVRRLLSLGAIPSGFDPRCVEVSTIHSFVRELGGALGISGSGQATHNQHCRTLAAYIEEGAVTESDMQGLALRRPELLVWDHVFIDEAQDCSSEERRLFYTLFGYQKMVVSDGIDQFVRGLPRCEWQANVYYDRAENTRCLRQKVNLASFANRYADQVEIPWHVDPVAAFTGGKVHTVKGADYPFQLLREVRDDCLNGNNDPYDMLFLVPPKLVSSQNGHRGFTGMDQFRENGFETWDGTRSTEDVLAPAAFEQHRLLQYDSCRGLEGWVVVCLHLDEFIRYKKSSFREDDIQDAGLSIRQKRDRFVGLWSLLPLTRAIDTLVVTLSQPDSPEAYDILKTAAEFQDFVHISQ